MWGKKNAVLFDQIFSGDENYNKIVEDFKYLLSDTSLANIFQFTGSGEQKKMGRWFTKYKFAQDNAKSLISQFGVKENKMMQVFHYINRLHDFSNFMFECWNSPNTKSNSHKQQLALRRVISTPFLSSQLKN